MLCCGGNKRKGGSSSSSSAATHMAERGNKPGTHKDKPPNSRSSSHSRGAGDSKAGKTSGSSSSPKGSPRKHRSSGGIPEMGIKNMAVTSGDCLLQTVEILKRPGQTLGFYIREGDGGDRGDGVFISRIAAGSVVENNGLLKVGDEILTVNSVDVTRTSLDDVVILMSIPKRLVLQIRTSRRGNAGTSSSKNNSCPSLCTIDQEEAPAPVVVLKNRGRSSSATAVEMTEKCPDEFSMPAGAEHSYYRQQPAPPGYNLLKAMEDASGGKMRGKMAASQPPKSSSQYSMGGYKLGPAPAGGCGGGGDDSGDSGLSSENSGYSATAPPNPATSAAPGGHYVSHGEIMAAAQTRRGIMGGPSPYAHLDYTSDSEAYLASHHGHSQHQEDIMARSVPRVYDAHSIRAFQEEIERTHHKYAAAVAGSKYKPQRQVSPDRYNSDSEVVTGGYQPRGRQAMKHEYLSHLLDIDDRCNSLPHMKQESSSSGNSEQLKLWLRKFDAFSSSGSFDASTTTLQAVPPMAAPTSQDKLQVHGQHHTGSSHLVPRSPSQSSALYHSGYLSDSATYTSEEYYSWMRQTSPTSSLNRHNPGDTTLPRSSPAPRHRGITRKLSADAAMEQRTYQMEEPAELAADHKYQALLANARGNAGSPRPALGTAGMRQRQHDGSASTNRQRSSNQQDSSSSNTTTTSTGETNKAAARFRELQLARKPLQVRPEEFSLYQPDNEPAPASASEQEPLHGLLYIHLLCGHGLRSPSRTVLRDLYTVLEVDAVNKARTMIRTGAINFDWDETFEIEADAGRELSFLVYSWDPNTRHRLCFSGTVGLHAFLAAGGADQKVALKLEPRGILYVHILYREPSAVLARTPSTRRRGDNTSGGGHPVFGVDLATLLRREGADATVPTVVRRAVEEVERRGMEHVGIYRLCGSSKRKGQLREEVERNPRGVDFSADNVSDINVVTGIIKDFLRELPEPLFTNSLYHMLLDATSVRNHGDPHGSAQLMLSVLECLPKANQDTMALILDHLKRVSLRADVNKMSTGNLAVCFGPVLLCPAVSPSAAAATVAADVRRHIEVLTYLLDIWPEDRVEKIAARRATDPDLTPRGDGATTPSRGKQLPSVGHKAKRSEDETTAWDTEQTSPC